MQERSAIWGGGTLGLFVGIIVSLFRGQYVETIVWAIIIGCVFGIIAEILGALSDRLKR